MNSIWLKIAGVVVVAIVVIVVAGRFQSEKPAPAPSAPGEAQEAEKPKTFYDVAERDKQFAQAPQPAEPAPAEQTPAPAEPAPPPTQPPVPAPAQPASTVVLPSSITQPTTLYFKPLSEEDDIAAQQLLPWAAAGRSIGRLPMVQYGLMVKACRQILERWPESSYAFQAKRMLEEISERYAANYKITPQDLDISRFLKPRQGTQPFKVEPLQR
jgi:hypothetical protein